jgi:hypothetical protein
MKLIVLDVRTDCTQPCISPAGPSFACSSAAWRACSSSCVCFAVLHLEKGASSPLSDGDDDDGDGDDDDALATWRRKAPLRVVALATARGRTMWASILDVAGDAYAIGRAEAVE